MAFFRRATATNLSISGTQRHVRVCMLSFYFSPEYSGSAVQARNLCRHLSKIDVEAFVVSANLSKSAWRDQISGVNLYRLPVLKHKTTLLPSFWISLAIFLIVKRRDYDVIHAHGTLLHAIASIVGRVLGKKSVLKVAMANSDIAFHRQGRVMGRINSYFVRHFDHYIAISRDIYQEFLGHGIDPSKISLLANGVDTLTYCPPTLEDEKQKLRTDLGVPGGIIICFVGMIIERKNVDLILRTWKQVVDTGVEGHLLLVGPIPKDGQGMEIQYGRELRQYVFDHDLASKVTFTGYQEVVSNYLRASDIFFFPSKQEGMPNVLLEAMACGLPCVVSRISGTEDLVEDGENGIILPLNQEDKFVSALLRLIQEPAFAARVGRAARTFVDCGYSLRITAEKYKLLYGRLLDGPNDGRQSK